MVHKIDNVYELIFHSILVLPIMFVGFVVGSLAIYSSLKEGIAFSWRELFKKNSSGGMSPLQWLLTGIAMIIGTVWMMFIRGVFLKYIDAVSSYFGIK